MLNFDSTVHLGDVATSLVLAIIGWVLHRSIKSVTSFIGRVDNFDGRIENTAEVVDLHSDALLNAGLTKGAVFGPVSKKRRKYDQGYSRL